MFKKATNFIKYHIYRIYYCYPYIFAHKPLCSRFEKDTLKIFNHLYFCRGCFAVYTGVVLTMCFGIIYKIKQPNIPVYIAILLMIMLSYPKIYKRFPRLIKDFVRSMNGAFLGLIIVLGINGQLILSFIGISLFILAKKKYNSLRTADKITACKGCLELHENKTCSGYRRQTEKMLLLEQALSENISL